LVEKKAHAGIINYFDAGRRRSWRGVPHAGSHGYTFLWEGMEVDKDKTCAGRKPWPEVVRRFKVKIEEGKISIRGWGGAVGNGRVKSLHEGTGRE